MIESEDTGLLKNIYLPRQTYTFWRKKCYLNVTTLKRKYIYLNKTVFF